MSQVITIASCQHPISNRIEKNLAFILKQIQSAKEQEADIVHFAECSLSGYAGIDFQEYDSGHEKEIKNAMLLIREKTASVHLKVIVGSHHYEPHLSRPFNSLFLIDEKGRIETRYDKRFLVGAEGEMDKKYYTPGENACVFQIRGIQCGLMICHEWRYPELYREYHQAGVQLLFQSWYDGSLSSIEYELDGPHQEELVMGTVKGNAANNYMWISGSNTSKRESCFGAFLVQPDGRVMSKLKRNIPGVLINKIDMNTSFIDPSRYGREKLKLKQNV